MRSRYSRISLELAAMTSEPLKELNEIYAEWKRDRPAHDPVESGDDYYWAGASSFREFLAAKITQRGLDLIHQIYLAGKTEEIDLSKPPGA